MTSPTDIFTIRFELTAEHVKLLRAAYVGWQTDEWGAPEIDPKRPYGNGDLDRDLWTVLEHDGDWKAADAAWDDGYGLPSNLTAPEWEERRGKLRRLHRETDTALQIVLRSGSFEPGIFEADRYRRDWRRVDGLSAEFDAWAEKEGLNLVGSQREAAHAILAGIELLGFGRGSGKTYVMERVQEFLDQRPVPVG